MSDYFITIGLEVHAQVRTASKMFDGCSADYAGSPPNTNVSIVSLGLPGSLPVVNARAVEWAALSGLALNCTVNQSSVFARKSYPYPDLPKGYQITQYESPICSDGWVEIRTEAGETKRVSIERLHIEEDTGRLVHASDVASLIDYNRSGVPLMEIVSRPDMSTAEEARLYFQKVRQMLVWIGVNSGNLEEGALRCDANISIRPPGQVEYGTKVEVKNMNSFRAVERAINYEVQRQIDVLEAGDVVIQETRGWNEAAGITVGQRSKELAHDYRYFPEPDLPPLMLDAGWIEARRAELPELPNERRDRFEREHGLSAQDADLLTSERAIADYYEAAVAAAQRVGASAKDVANWVLNELFRLLKDNGEPAENLATRLPTEHLVSLLDLLGKSSVNRTVAKQVFEQSFATGNDPATIVAEQGLTQISDSDELVAVAREVIADAKHVKAVNEYRSGKTNAIQYLVGQVMKATKGKANPQIVRTTLEAVLEDDK